MTRKIMELSIAVFFLVLSAVVAFTTVEMSRLARTTSDQYLAALAAQSKQQDELLNAARDFQTIVTEGGFALTARGMEQQGLFSPTDANRVVGEAIGRIEERSPRLGMFVKSMNDAYLSGQTR
jgi:hypothetical protein